MTKQFELAAWNSPLARRRVFLTFDTALVAPPSTDRVPSDSHRSDARFASASRSAFDLCDYAEMIS